MKRYLLAFAILAAAAVYLRSQAAKTSERPPIVGVAHIGLETNNMDAARQFYGKQLGYEEPFSLD